MSNAVDGKLNAKRRVVASALGENNEVDQDRKMAGSAESTMSVTLPERLAGGIWGHLVGDAAGVPYEFKQPGQIGAIEFGGGGAHGQPVGTWSDDGALMLALLDSLLRDRSAGKDRFDPADQGQRFLAWADTKQYTPDGDGRFDIGGATRAALARLRQGTPAEAAGGTDDMSNGNGSLMRILPLALVERDIADETLVDHARRASAVTHGHPIAQTACALYCLVARRLLAGAEPTAALADARKLLRSLCAGRDAQALDTLEAWTGRSGQGYVVDAFWSAWDAFAGAAGYREAIERAIQYGNDTDTTACIAGGLAGVHWGIDGIPPEWLAVMRGRSIVAPLVDRLIATDGWRTSSASPLRVDWVDLGRVPRFAGWSGRLGMTFLPGKQRDGWSGQHWRDLEADVERLREHWAVDVVLLLVEDHELVTARVIGIVEVLTAHGIEVVRLPIVDEGVPADRPAFRSILDLLIDRIRAGQSVVVACRGGLGRTGTVVGCLLRDGGLGPDEAIALVRATRHHTINSDPQAPLVRDWDWPNRDSRDGTASAQPAPVTERLATAAERSDAIAFVRDLLRGLRPLVTMSSAGLILVALEAPAGTASGKGAQPLLAHEAAASGDLVIREINGGSVPTLEAVTQGQAVLLLAGDTVVGGKQNRIINITIWLPPAVATPIPVSCLEAGRWDAGNAFAAGRRVDVRMRGLVNQMVTERSFRERSDAAAAAAPSYMANQAGIWDEIGRRSGRAGIRSETAALHEVYRSEEADISAIARAFPVPTGARGVAVGIGGRLVGLEVFQDPTLLERAWPRVVESAVSAHLDHLRAVAAKIEPKAPHRYPDPGALGRMVKRADVALDGAAVARSVGEGVDVRVSSQKINGAALVRGRQVTHLELFRPPTAKDHRDPLA